MHIRRIHGRAGMNLLGVLAGTALIAGAAIAWNDTPKPKVKKNALIERGEYLVKITGCGDCHSPYGPDGKHIPGKEFSGHPEGAPLPEWDPSMMQKNILATINPTFTAFASPMGVAIAGNLTPDMETGIGKLTAEMLIESWRTGKHWKFDKRPVLPPMPMEAYKNMTDDDIRAIHAYLSSLAPIKNKVPASIVKMGPDH